MLYIPINKTTQHRYPVITEEQKKANDSDLIIRSKYRYEVVQGSDEQAAPAPAEAKKFNKSVEAEK